MMESDPFMGSAFDFGGSGGGGGMGYGTSFYETFVRPAQQANFDKGGKRGSQYGYWVRETVDNNGRIVYPNGIAGGGNIPEVTISYRFVPIELQSSWGEKGNSFLNNLQNALPVAITWAAVGSAE